MKIVVTGGAGYVGAHTVRELVSAGHNIRILDNLSRGYRTLCAEHPLVVGDIADQQVVTDALCGAEAVVHFAASAYVTESLTAPREYFHNNISSTLTFLDMLLASSVRLLVFSSSCAVYGAPTCLPITEDSPTVPLSPYGDSKLCIERILAAYSHAYGLRYVALRYFNAAGAHIDGTMGECHEPETHIIPLAIQAALGFRPPLTVYGAGLSTQDGSCIRDFVHVSDLGRAHVRALEYLSEGGKSVTLNLGTGTGTSILSLLSSITRIAGSEVPLRVLPLRLGDPPAVYANCEKAARVLGWKATLDLTQIVATALRWERIGRRRVLAEKELERAHLACALRW